MRPRSFPAFLPRSFPALLLRIWIMTSVLLGLDARIRKETRCAPHPPHMHPSVRDHMDSLQGAAAGEDRQQTDGEQEIGPDGMHARPYTLRSLLRYMCAGAFLTGRTVLT